MTDISVRDLRKNLDGVLRRVEVGERIRVMVNGRPVAELAPCEARPRLISWEALMSGGEDWRADPGLAKDMAELLPDTTDNVQVR